MNRKIKQLIASLAIMTLLIGGVSSISYANPKQEVKPENTEGGNKYSLEQAMSDRAQLTTIAYSGLAFITGDYAADTFMPPGKVADFFGFQYMRDVDVAGYGHNTQFLSRVANNILYILNDEQLEKLVTLAKSQAPLYESFAYNRLPLIDAFRAELEERYSDDLNIENAGLYTKALYEYDADLSYERAITMGEIIHSFTDDQVAYLSKMAFNDFNTWPDVEENEALKKSLSHTEHVAVMTYASEMFSWYKGSVEADIYFCPERHGTYFGGFFLKDFPAMNNPDYFIPTTVTGNKGDLFLDILDTKQRALMSSILTEQEDAMQEIAELRTSISKELRKAQTGVSIDKDYVYELIGRYGQLDGELSALYARTFATINASLTDAQRAEVEALRELETTVEGAYLFSSLVDLPVLPSIDYLFGDQEMDQEAGRYAVPEGYEAKDQKQENKKDQPKKDDDGKPSPPPRRDAITSPTVKENND